MQADRVVLSNQTGLLSGVPPVAQVVVSEEFEKIEIGAGFDDVLYMGGAKPHSGPWSGVLFRVL